MNEDPLTIIREFRKFLADKWGKPTRPFSHATNNAGAFYPFCLIAKHGQVRCDSYYNSLASYLQPQEPISSRFLLLEVLTTFAYWCVGDDLGPPRQVAERFLDALDGTKTDDQPFAPSPRHLQLRLRVL